MPTKAKPAPTDAPPTVIEHTNPNFRTERHSREVWGQERQDEGRGKTTTAAAPTQSERKHEQPSTIARVEGKLTGKLSAIDAAAKVLETSGPMNCKELIEAMSAGGLWTSPGGKTPHATCTWPFCARLQPRVTNLRSLRRDGGDLQSADL